MRRILLAVLLMLSLTLTGCVYTTAPDAPLSGDKPAEGKNEEQKPENPDTEDSQTTDPAADPETLADCISRYTGEKVTADETLIRAMATYQQQEGRQNYEWSLLPVFSQEIAPDWDSLTLYAYMMCEDTGVDAEGYSTMTAQAFDQTVERYLEGVDYTPKDSSYFTYADGVYTSTGWGDIMGDFLLPVSLTANADGTYTMELVGYQFYEWDFVPGETTCSPLMEAFMEIAGGQRPESPKEALLECYLDEELRSSLPVSSQQTVTFRLTGEEETPFRYLACVRALPGA